MDKVSGSVHGAVEWSSGLNVETMSAYANSVPVTFPTELRDEIAITVADRGDPAEVIGNAGAPSSWCHLY